MSQVELQDIQRQVNEVYTAVQSQWPGFKTRIGQEQMFKEISQTDFADLLAVSRQTIHAIETGKYIPTTTLALKIAKLLNKKVEEIFILEKGD